MNRLRARTRTSPLGDDLRDPRNAETTSNIWDEMQAREGSMGPDVHGPETHGVNRALHEEYGPDSTGGLRF